MRRLLLLVLVLTGCASAPRTAGRPTAVDDLLPLPTRAQEVVVVHHTDGDTLSVRALAPGPFLSSTRKTKVRLLEIDTPETVKPQTPVQCFGREASARLDELAPLGAHLWVVADREPTDRYGRALLYLWTSQGRSINLSLVSDGFARADYVRPNDRYLTQVDAAQAQAQRAGRGLWGACGGFPFT